MPIYVKQEMSDAVGVGSHKKKAYYRLKTFSNFSTEQLVEYISRNENLPEAQVYAVLVGLRHQMARIMGTGHTVTIDGLGTFRPTLGMEDDKEVESLEPDEEGRRNAQSIKVSHVRFKADKRFVEEVDSCTTLERGKDQRIKTPSSTREERLAVLKEYLAQHQFIQIVEYMRLVHINRNRATRELREFKADRSTGISSKGLGTHKVYVLRKTEE